MTARAHRWINTTLSTVALALGIALAVSVEWRCPPPVPAVGHFLDQLGLTEG